MVRGIALASLTALCGCLQAPPGSGPDGQTDAGIPDPDGAILTPDGGSPAGCDTAFAVAYISKLSARPDQGSYAGMAVIEAIGDAVNLDFLGEGPDDSAQVELELSQVAYELTSPGSSRGLLATAAESLIVDGGLIDRPTWDGSAPTFQLSFADLPPDDTPMPHHLEANVNVGGSVATLAFDIIYDPKQPAPAVPKEAARVASTCPE